jgi:hypothetical protein
MTRIERAIAVGIVGAIAGLLCACSQPGGGTSDFSGIVLETANQPIKTITATGFANGAGPWTAPSNCTGVFMQVIVDNSSASPVLIALRAGDTGNSGDDLFLRLTVDASAHLTARYPCPFWYPTTTFKAWQDDLVGASDLTGVSLSVEPTYWLIGY